MSRYYDPATGRYIQADPIGLGGGWNRFAYVGGNPLSYVDSSGLIRLPSDPSGLPSGWALDPSHRNPNGERYKNPDGETLDFHPGMSGAPGFGGEDHWHWSGKPKWHYRPGDECPTSDTPGEDNQPTNRSNITKMPSWLPFILLIPFPGNPIYGGL